jgi:hypothetical protein
MKRVALAAAVAALSTACGPSFELDSSSSTQTTRSQPPHVASIDVAAWPPLGPTSSVHVRCTDDRALRAVRARFRREAYHDVTGADVHQTFTGAELGEGMGTLQIVAEDTDGQTVTREVRDFVVDLTPPKIEIERTVASPYVDGVGGEIGVWVGDAWVLGSVEVTFDGKLVRQSFPQAYPATLGKSWDWSRLAISAKELEPGARRMHVVARDAAGNVSEQDVDLRIDATSPTLSLAVAGGQHTVRGIARIGYFAADDAPGVVTVELMVGGSAAGTFVGPSGEAVLDLTGYPRGPLEVSAVARDEAGNVSAEQKLTLTVE